MNSSDNKKWNFTLVAVCCVIIIAGIAIIFISPWSGFSFGTCVTDTIPMTSTSSIQPAFATSFLQEFGESEPDPGPNLPPILHYPLRKGIIDSLMGRAQVTGTEDAIIGLYEFPDSRLLLINQDTSVAEILETGEGIRTYTLVPEPVGTQYTGANNTGPAQHGAYNSSTEHNVTIQRIHLVLPQKGNETAPVYIVKKTRTEKFLYPDGSEFFSVSTTGTFFVLYGQRVERVVTSVVVTLDPQWTLCSQQTGISGEGSTMGELRHTVKLARSSERMLHAHLITTGAHIQVHEASGGSTSQWKSRDSTGCRC